MEGQDPCTVCRYEAYRVDVIRYLSGYHVHPTPQPVPTSRLAEQFSGEEPGLDREFLLAKSHEACRIRCDIKINQGPGPSLSTFCEEMPRLVNAPAFDLDELVGAAICDLVGCVHDNEPFGVEMLFIRLEGDRLWHRLFLQAGIGFWEKWPEDEAFGDYLDYRRIDFGKRWGLSGLKILSAECIGSNWEDAGVSEFKIGFETGLLNFRFSDPDDVDSEAVLDFHANTNINTEQAGGDQPATRGGVDA